MVEKEQRKFLIGIISHGVTENCAKNKPAFNTDVYKVLHYLKKYIFDNCKCKFVYPFDNSNFPFRDGIDFYLP
jgi:hypothetical protein